MPLGVLLHAGNSMGIASRVSLFLGLQTLGAPAFWLSHVCLFLDFTRISKNVCLDGANGST